MSSRSGETASSRRGQCQAVTRRGEPCKKAAVTGLTVCHTHLDQRETADSAPTSDSEEDRPVWERQAEKHLRGGA